MFCFSFKTFNVVLFSLTITGSMNTQQNTIKVNMHNLNMPSNANAFSLSNMFSMVRSTEMNTGKDIR